MHRLLLAPAVAGVLLLGTYTGTALAAEAPDPPTANCTALQQQLAALKVDLQTAIDAGTSTTTLDTQVKVTTGLVDEACAPVDPPVTTDPTDDPAPTTDAPAPTTDAPATDTPPVYYENCAAAIQAGVAPIVLANGEPGYRPALDSDNDGIACEANESDAGGPDPTPSTDNSGTLGGSDSSGSGTVDSVPSGSVDTGYVAG